MKKRFWIGFLIGAFLIKGYLQETPIPHLIPPTVNTQSTETEVNLQQNIQDFQSPDPAIRRRAILILGKFPANIEIITLFLQALSDPHPRVREAALISFQEYKTWNHPGIVPAILAKILDPDPTNRRIASSMLTRCLQEFYFPFARIRKEDPSSLNLLTQFEQIFEKAVQDNDVIVRRNIAANLASLVSSFRLSIFLPLLQDQDTEVRMLSLICMLPVMDLANFKVHIQKFLQDPYPKIRLQALQLIQQRGQTELLPILKETYNDPDPNIRFLSQEIALQMGDTSVWKDLRVLLLNPQTEDTKKIRILQLMPRIPYSEARNTLTTLIENQGISLKVKAEALRQYFSVIGRFPDIQTLVLLTQQDEPSLRKAALEHLTPHLGSPTSTSTELVRTLLTSPFIDVRLGSLRFLLNYSNDQVKDWLVDLFFDDYQPIRQEALKIIAIKKIPGWLELLIDALQDAQSEIRWEAATQLMFSIKSESTENQNLIKKALQNYVQNGTDENLRRTIQRFLTKPNL